MSLNIPLVSHHAIDIFGNLKKYDHIKKNSVKTAKKYTWEKRVKKIILKFF